MPSPKPVGAPVTDLRITKTNGVTGVVGQVPIEAPVPAFHGEHGHRIGYAAMTPVLATVAAPISGDPLQGVSLAGCRHVDEVKLREPDGDAA